jgi:hypothetical protein
LSAIVGGGTLSDPFKTSDPHPPVLTTLVRPNFVVGDEYCLCYITETSPTEGVAFHTKGSFKATAICDDNVADRFASGEAFELRAAKRVFAKGVFRQIFAKTLEPELAKP